MRRNNCLKKNDTGTPVKLEGHFIRFIVFEAPFVSAITWFINPPQPGNILVGETCFAPKLRNVLCILNANWGTVLRLQLKHMSLRFEELQVFLEATGECSASISFNLLSTTAHRWCEHHSEFDRDNQYPLCFRITDSLRCRNCNRPFPSSLVSVSQNESKCKTFYKGNYKTRMSRKFS